MRKALVFFLILSSNSYFDFAQFLPDTPKPYPEIAIVKVAQPLIIIGTLETNHHSLVVDPEDLEIINTYKDSLELLPFGEKGKDGIILARVKKNIPLLRLEEVLDYYKVPAANRTLKVMVNKSLVHPNLFLADVSRIEKIEKIKQDITSPMLYSLNQEEEFLNIVTEKK